MSLSATIPNRTEEEIRDLGFGSVVSRESRQRLLNRDGTFNVERNLPGWASLNPYHHFLTMSWARFMAVVMVAYLLLNALFAGAYMLCGVGSLLNTVTGQANLDFAKAFFFSVQTFATIGYGQIVPVGIAANIVVTFESLVGLLVFALATGLLFARFSRPTAAIVFSQHALVAPYRGQTAFEFRIINKRNNQLLEVEAKVIFTRFEPGDSAPIRRYYLLPLERSKVAFFPLSWTVVHPIDEASPLRGLTREELIASNGEFLILLTAIDETFSQSVQSRSSYIAEELIWNARFANMFDRRNGGEKLSVDMDRFHAIERLSSEPQPGTMKLT